MACARSLGFVDVPIVCVNVDGYYEPFLRMLRRAYDDGLLKAEPGDLVRFEPTAEAAVGRIEAELARRSGDEGGGRKEPARRKGRSRVAVFLSSAPVAAAVSAALAFAVGVAFGVRRGRATNRR